MQIFPWFYNDHRVSHEVLGATCLPNRRSEMFAGPARFSGGNMRVSGNQDTKNTHDKIGVGIPTIY